MFADTEALCRQILAPYHDRFWSLVHDAWGMLLLQPEPIQRFIRSDSTTRANWMNTMVSNAAIESLSTDPAVRVLPNGKKIAFLLHDQVYLRFKYLPQDQLTRNFPTPRATRMDANLELDGIPPQAIRVAVGYQLDPLQSEISRVLVAHRNATALLWSYEVESTATSTIPIQLPLDHQTDELPAIRATGTSDDAAKRQGTDDT